jgi:autotransporter-associated beta strand protein
MRIRSTMFVLIGLTFITATPIKAVTQYTWNGTASSDWMDSGSWNSGSIAPTGVVSDTRLNVNNGTGGELIYSAALGTTVFAGTGTNPRSLVIANGAGTSGQLRITGGTLEARGYTDNIAVSAADIIGAYGGSGKLIIDGGIYLRTNDIPSGVENGAELQIGYSTTANTKGELIVSNGLARVRRIRLNHHNSSNVSSIIRLIGGTLETAAIECSSATGTRAIYFNGGTLKPLYVNLADWVSNTITILIQDNGAIIDTGDFENGVAASIISDGASSGSLIKKGNGILKLLGNNTYSGLTVVTGGVLRVAHPNALGSTAMGTVVPSGSRLELSGSVTLAAEPLTLYGNGGGLGLGALLSVEGTNTWTGPVTLGISQARVGAFGGHLVISGPIGDNGNHYDLLIRHSGGNLTDTVTLSGTNTYGGRTIIYQGVVKLDGGDNRLPVVSVLQLGYYATGYPLTGHFDLNGRNQEVAGLLVNPNVPETQPELRTSQTVKNDAEALSVLTLNNTTDYMFTGTLTGNLGLTKKGAGTFTLAGTNSYSGPTSVSNGVLQLVQADCLSASTDVVISTADAATLDLSFTGTNTVRSLTVDGARKYKNKVYNASNLPSAITGTGCLLTLEGIQGCLIRFR